MNEISPLAYVVTYPAELDLPRDGPISMNPSLVEANPASQISASQKASNSHHGNHHKLLRHGKKSKP
jgi:hypothetical protein